MKRRSCKLRRAGGELDISPMDVLAAVPYPISLFAMVGDHYINAKIEEINRAFWEEANWNMVMNWEQWKTEPGIPNEQLYMYYTDQREKYNPEIAPTSIVITSVKLVWI